MEVFTIPDSLTSLEEDDQYRMFLSPTFEFFDIDPSDSIDFLDEGFFLLSLSVHQCTFFADLYNVYSLFDIYVVDISYVYV